MVAKWRPSSKMAIIRVKVGDLTVLFFIVITRPPLQQFTVNSPVAYASLAACAADGQQV